MKIESKNLDRYGSEPLPWARVLEALEAPGERTTFWLATVDADGAPHVAGVGALWVDHKLFFTSGPGTRKSRNLSRNASCVISVALTGLDLVVEGEAVKVRDKETLKRLAERYAAQGWPATATDDAITAEYSAPSAGPPPWDLYEV